MNPSVSSKLIISTSENKFVLFFEISSCKNFSNSLIELRIQKEFSNGKIIETYEQKQRNVIMLSLGLISVFSGACFCFLSLLLFYYNQIDLTEFIFVLTISVRLSGVAFGVNWSVNNLSRTYGTINSALETLAVEPDIIDSENAKELVSAAKNLKSQFGIELPQEIYQIAKEKGDRDFKKLMTLWKLERFIEAKLEKRYAAQAKQLAKQAMKNSKNTKSKAVQKATNKANLLLGKGVM